MSREFVDAIVDGNNIEAAEKFLPKPWLTKLVIL